MTDYLSKPFKIAPLSEMLERWLPLQPPAAAAPDPLMSVDHESAIDSRVFDDFREPGEDRGANAFVIELIDEYLSDTATRMGAMKDAIDRRDGPAVRLGAHSLKGSSSTVGATKMADICDELETLARLTTYDLMPAVFVALESEFVRVGIALRIEQGTTA